MILLGIGNVLQKDDGLGVYASTYLKENYTFSKKVEIINGGVEGINLFSIFERGDDILILDTIELDDEPASIYLLPSHELSGHGLNSGGAHEIGVLQCIDMLELQGKPIPGSTILAMVPRHITFEIGLSKTIEKAFGGYIGTALDFLKREGIESRKKKESLSLEQIIHEVKRV